MLTTDGRAASYEALCALPVSDASVIASIERDLVRTFAGQSTALNTDATAKTSLKRVLLAHAVRNTQIGYSQGLNHVAGFFFCVPGIDEEDCFWLLCALTERLCRGYYEPAMPGLCRDFRVIRELVHVRMPDVLRHMDIIGAPLGAIVTGSWLSHFVLHVPSHTLLRLLDVSLWMGSSALMIAVLALMRLRKEEILRASSLAEIKEIWQEFELRCYDADALLRAMHWEWEALDTGSGAHETIASFRAKHTRVS